MNVGYKVRIKSEYELKGEFGVDKKTGKLKVWLPYNYDNIKDRLANTTFEIIFKHKIPTEYKEEVGDDYIYGIEFEKSIYLFNSKTFNQIEYSNNTYKNVGIYTGNFNPFHNGHKNIVRKAKDIFKKVIVVQLINNKHIDYSIEDLRISNDPYGEVNVLALDLNKNKLFKNLNKYNIAKCFNSKHIIRGLHNNSNIQRELSIAELHYNYYNSELCSNIVYINGSKEYNHLDNKLLNTQEDIEQITRDISYEI